MILPHRETNTGIDLRTRVRQQLCVGMSLKQEICTSSLCFSLRYNISRACGRQSPHTTVIRRSQQRALVSPLCFCNTVETLCATRTNKTIAVAPLGAELSAATNKAPPCNTKLRNSHKQKKEPRKHSQKPIGRHTTRILPQPRHTRHSAATIQIPHHSPQLTD